MTPPITWKGNAELIKQWSGEELHLSDRVTTTDVYRGPVYKCRWGALLRGTYGTGDRLGWVVTSSKVQTERKGIGLLVISWEVGGPWGDPALLPLSDFRCEAVELYPKVERNHNLVHPGGEDVGICTEAISLCYQAVHGAPKSNSDARAQVMKMADRKGPPPTGSNWSDQAILAKVLLEWLDHGHETYYEAGVKYSYVWYSFTWPTLSKGGVIEPFPNAGPMMGDASRSWLRLADVPEPAGVNGSVYKITSTWLGGSDGHWDKLLYS